MEQGEEEEAREVRSKCCDGHGDHNQARQTANVMDARRPANEQASPATPGLLYDTGTSIKLSTL